MDVLEYAPSNRSTGKMMDKAIPLNGHTEAIVSPFTVGISQRNCVGTMHFVLLSRKEFLTLIQESGVLMETEEFHGRQAEDR
jgi:hypothetical protein